jgi:hypothetical protein
LSSSISSAVEDAVVVIVVGNDDNCEGRCNLDIVEVGDKVVDNMKFWKCRTL